MHLFADYVHPLTSWLYENPNWALLIAFVMSFAESLAIIGSLVPGSVTMTAIGILAGSGVMNIGLTLAAATTGAVAGDSASYALGYIFSDRLTEMWPFRRYPHWLEYGKDFFAKHGGKSVIIGRFFGPLRSIIPVIAGILHMNGWLFFFANIISAIGWALLYVMPGVLIGAASTELSAESATRLFMFILLTLAILWLLTQGIKRLWLHANHILHTQLRKIWIWSKSHPICASLFKKLSPKYERIHYPTVGLVLLFSVCFFMSILITLFVIQGTWISTIDNPCHLFLQSLRTQYFDAFFIAMSLVISPLPLLTFALAVSVCTLYYRNWRMLRFWLILVLSCSSIAWFLSVLIDIPKLGGLLQYQSAPTFPAINLTMATALFGFFIGYSNAYFRTIPMLVLRIILTSLLFLAGLALIYLGDNWASSIIAAYFIGLTICLVHWIYYRRIPQSLHAPRRSSTPIILAFSILLITTGIIYPVYFKKTVHEHTPYRKQYVLTHKAWWNQTQTLLPVYTRNRVGNRIGLFNMQYLGSLKALETALENHGWKKQPNSVFYSLLMRASGQNSARESPLMAQLYLNKKPDLIMIYPNDQGQTLYSLRLWRSNYHLRNYTQPIWLASIISLQEKAKPFSRILPALTDFKLNILTLPNDKHIKALPNANQPTLLMIKERVTIHNKL